MKIFEITDKNKVILGISNINIDFDAEYNMLVKLLEIMIKMKSPSRNLKALENIEQFKNRIQQFYQNTLLDKLDPDIIILTKKLKQMESHIDSLKSQLKF